ncbi:MAG: aminotransferase class IV [Bacteroidales bacterium]|nr:aminotransferase class IV [Bacteroidales bacterium]
MKSPINVYEVVKVIGSKPLFLKEHHSRFENSVKFLNVNVICEQAFRDQVCMAIKSLNLVNGNLRIDTFIDDITTNCDIIVKQIPHHYPTEEQYRDGVKTSLFEFERPNPNKKIWNAQLRKQVDEILNSSDFYEVIYYNSEHIVAEGSRSNVFFILGEELLTPKVGAVLPGITRQKIIELAYSLNLRVIEKDIKISEIEKFDAAFLSGTSPDILPISSMENIAFDVTNHLMRSLMNEFKEIIASDFYSFPNC